MTVFRRLYGDNVLHLIVLLGALALAGYSISVLGVANLFNPAVWWQSIAVWFAVAVIGHDLILFPLYALLDRLLPSARRTPSRQPSAADADPRRVPLTNYLRLPTMAAGFTFLLFFPGIVVQGASSYHAATGLTQEPFLTRWLLLTAACYLISAACYVVRIVLRQRNSAIVSAEPRPQSGAPESNSPRSAG